MNILLVEDNTELAICLWETLIDEGHEVTWAKDRKDIPPKLSAFNMVLSDYHVPGGTFEQTELACEKQNVPLLLMSGGMFNSPHRPFLAKPFDNLELLELVNRVGGQ